LPIQRKPGGKAFFCGFLPEFLLNIRETAEVGAAVLRFGFYSSV